MAKDAVIKLSLVDGVSKNLDEIRKGVTGLGSELVKINQAADLAGKAFGALASVGGFFGDLVTDAGAYEQKLIEVEVRTQATAEESILLRDAVQQAMQSTAVGATAAADALRLMAEDGATATESAQNLGEVVAYAQANTRGLAETVGNLGAALDAFGEAPAKIGALADSLTATAVAAGTSTKAIEEGLARAGIAAEQANLSIDETVALIGAFAARGLEGGRGGAALVKVLQELADPASKAGEALKQAGIDGSDLSGVIQKLATDAKLSEKVLAGLGDKPRAALRLLLDDGGKSLAGITKAIEGSAGASQRASDQIGDGFALAQKRLAESLENMKIALATPLLDPLAIAFDNFATRINTFANSEQFKQIADEIAQFVVVGLGKIEEFVAGFDFEQAAESVRLFVEDSAANLEALRFALGLTLNSAGNFGDGLSAAFNASIAAVSLNLAGLIGALGGVSDEAESLSLSLAKIGNDAFIETGDALGRIADRADKAAAAAAKAAQSTEKLGKSTIDAVGPLNAFGKSLEDQLRSTEGLAPAFDATRNSVMRLVESEQKLTQAQNDVAQSLSAASIAQYEVQISRLIVQQTALFNSGQQNSAEFRRLTAEIGAAESGIAKLKEANAAAAKSADDVAGATDRATQSVRNYSNAADGAQQSADRVTQSNSQVRESFGNVGAAASEAAISLGNMSEAYARLAIEAAGAQTSQDGYVDTLNSFFNAAVEQDRLIAQRIELLNRQNSALDAESLLRRQLELQYGTGSTRLEELVQAELRVANARRQANDEAERGIEIEQRRAGQAGGLGTRGQSAADAGTGATAGRGAGGGTATRTGGEPAQIVVNVQGAPTDAAGWRDIVSRFIAPELERISRLSR